MRFAASFCVLIFLTLDFASFIVLGERAKGDEKPSPRFVKLQKKSSFIDSYDHDAGGNLLPAIEGLGNVVQMPNGRIFAITIGVADYWSTGDYDTEYFKYKDKPRHEVLNLKTILDPPPKRWLEPYLKERIGLKNILNIVEYVDSERKSYVYDGVELDHTFIDAYHDGLRQVKEHGDIKREFYLYSREGGEAIEVRAGDGKRADENRFQLKLADLFRLRNRKILASTKPTVLNDANYRFARLRGKEGRGIYFGFFSERQLLNCQKHPDIDADILPRFAVHITDYKKDERAPVAKTGYYYEWNENEGYWDLHGGVSSPKSTPSTDVASIIYEQNKAGVVRIRTEVASGSGFVVSDAGEILTNKHVVDGAKDGLLQVLFGTKDEWVDARVVRTHDSLDLAVVRPIEKKSSLRVLKVNQTLPSVGDAVVVIGNPADLGFTLTKGVVSAIREAGRIENGTAMIQTDAAVNPGNSGGPMFDANGLVIGIITLKGKGEGIGYAIPASTAWKFFLEK